jgi:hypothetical protein
VEGSVVGDYYFAEVIFGPVRADLVGEAALRMPMRNGERGVESDADFVAVEGGGRVYRYEAEQANCGLEDGDVADLMAWCREHGIPYAGQDCGSDQTPGRQVRWAPGMEAEFSVEAEYGSAPYMTEGAWKLAKAEHLEGLSGGLESGREQLEALIAAVDRHFGVGIVPAEHPSLAAWLRGRVAAA